MSVKWLSSYDFINFSLGKIWQDFKDFRYFIQARIIQTTTCHLLCNNYKIFDAVCCKPIIITQKSRYNHCLLILPRTNIYYHQTMLCHFISNHFTHTYTHTHDKHRHRCKRCEFVHFSIIISGENQMSG